VVIHCPQILDSYATSVNRLPYSNSNFQQQLSLSKVWQQLNTLSPFPRSSNLNRDQIFIITKGSTEFMKKMVFFLFFSHSCLCLHAQQNLGIRSSNYAGIQGTLLNPSSIAESKLKWDVNVLSVGEVFDNSFLYAPKNSLPFFGIGRIIRGIKHEDLFLTHFNPGDLNKQYNFTFSAEFLGPSFFIKIAKKHVIGLTI